jgi:predicted RNA binding protein YcfA (HicA-like mRNA interferase family)
LSKLRTVDADKVVKAFARIGFQILRLHDSHLILKHPDGRVTVVPSIKEKEIAVISAYSTSKVHKYLGK